MLADLYLIVQRSLIEDGWSLGLLQPDGTFTAARDQEQLTAQIYAGTDLSQIEAAYTYLLDLLPGDPDRRVAIVLTPQGYEAAYEVRMQAVDRLKVALLIVLGDGRLSEVPAQSLAVRDLPRGPAGWRNWHAPT